MEPDVIRMYSSSPPPMDDPLEDEEEDEFGDFGTFSSGGGGVGGVPNSVSFSEFETPTTFNQTQALNATSPPELTHGRGLICADAGAKANGHAGKAEKTVKDLSNAELQTETLTNGFQGSPSSQKSVPFSQDNEEDFADFAAFSDKANEDLEETLDDKKQSGEFGDFEERNAVQPETANSNRTETEFASFAAFSEVNSEGTLDDEQSNAVLSQRGVADLEEHADATLAENSIPNRTEPEFADFNAFSEDCTLENNFTGSETAEFVSKDEEFAGFAFFPEKDTKTQTNEDCSSLNGNAFDASGSVCSSDLASESDCGVENVESSKPIVAVVNGMSEKDKDGSSETETETSFGRPLSTEALEEFGDMSTTGSVPSPPLQEETATPTGDDDDEEFGDFGDCLSAPEFGNFEQNKPQNADGEPVGDEVEEDEDDFGDFNSPKFIKEERGEAEFPTSESFGNFSSAAAAEEEEGEAAEEEEEGGWSAFGNEETREETEGESWAAFSSEEIKEEPSRTDKTTASLSDRLEKLFHSSFPQVDAPSINDEAPSLRLLLEPDTQQAESHRSLCVWVWAHMQDIHEALGLRYQWGGSHCNKALLCCLGIDTRNILFTGQKKQPVIVPMYAAGLGMLEPVKPVSAAEMIASIGQNSPCSSESVQQEALPPVQFDWSSSGLTNPLDASGGSSLLNLDFFGPVEDSESGAASIPGVDPELFELTTAKLDSSKVTDAFARLMSTVQSTSTSTRKPRREENLSEEALKVISMFPDLSFMTAKVLMFPTTLTPHGAQTAESSETEPGPGPENGAD